MAGQRKQRKTKRPLSRDANEELVSKFRKTIGQKMCFPEHPQQTTHISDLPLELISNIMKIVASYDTEQLAVLNQCAAVCRGWYLCARDPMIYRATCYKLWSRNDQELSNYGGSWRRMFLERPRVLTLGFYVTKRVGQPYEYLKFFPGGDVIRWSSTHGPKTVASFLQTSGTILEPDSYAFEDDYLFVTTKKPDYRLPDCLGYCDGVVDEDKFNQIMMFNISNYKSIPRGKLQLEIVSTICQSCGTFETEESRLPSYRYIATLLNVCKRKKLSNVI